MIIFNDGNGGTHAVRNGLGMLEAMGHNPRKDIVITDESGEIVGMGRGIEAAMGSAPLIKALKQDILLAKAAPTAEQRFVLKKAASKPQSDLNQLINDLTALQKSMGSSGAQSNTPRPTIDSVDARLTRLEADIAMIANHITNK